MWSFCLLFLTGEIIFPVIEMNSREIEKVKIPQGACGFYFFNLTDDGEKVNLSPEYYYGDKLYNADELEREFPGELITRVIKNNGCQALHCLDSWIIFNENSHIFVG